jgi:hypothetical protein
MYKRTTLHNPIPHSMHQGKNRVKEKSCTASANGSQ